MDRRKIKLIVIHCSASPNGRPASIEDIDAWHHERGFNRQPLWRAYFNRDVASVGYHYVIGVDGKVYTGRHHDEVGAHAKGHNQHSLGVCMIGTDRFSLMQWYALRDLIQKLSDTNDSPEVVGHRDLPAVAKTCPGFPVSQWLAESMVPMAGHILSDDGVRDE